MRIPASGRSNASIAFALPVLIALITLPVTLAHAALEVSAKATQNVTCSAGVCSATSADAVLNAGELANMLASGDVAVNSGNQARDIEIDAALSWTSISRLTLDAYHAITFNKPVEVMDAGALTITTNDGGKGGDFRFIEKANVKFSDTNSNLVINGNQFVLAKSVKQIGLLAKQGTFYIALAKHIDAGKHEAYASLPHAPKVFEGLGHSISNLSVIDGTSRGNVGFFAGAATVRDFGLLNANIVGTGVEQRVGSIAGEIDGAIVNCYATGEVSATDTESRVGGLVGVNTGTVMFSHADASVISHDDAVAAGGLAGQNDGTVEESYSTGGVTGGDNVMTGGLIGQNLAGAINNSYATGAVAGGNNGFVGGIVGANSNSDSSSPKIMSSYSTGTVVGGSGAMIGGMIGEDLAQSGTTNSYWDLDTSGINNPAQGAGNVQNDPGITGLTTQQFASGLPAGFSSSIWKEKAKIGGGYPYLIDNPPQ